MIRCIVWSGKRKGKSTRAWVSAVCFGLILATAPAVAGGQDQEVAGIPQPDRVSVSGHDLVLNGAGLRRILFVRVYTAALYLPDRQHDPKLILDRDAPRSLQLTLLHDLSTEQNLGALKGGLIANNTPEQMAAIRPEVDRFLGYIGSLHEVARGTVIRLDYQPGTGTLVGVNGRHVGTVAGAEFNQAMMRIWLGDNPVQLSLKQALLGEN